MGLGKYLPDIMKSAYLKAPFQFEVRDQEMREIKNDEVLVKIKACGYCGHDMILSRYAATDWEPFGHEFSGVVEKVGSAVTHLKVGDTIVMETSTFNPLAECSLNGNVDYDLNGPSFMNNTTETKGFAEYTIVPACLCIKFDGISFEEGSFIEPMGVALDLVTTADIKLNNDVLILGAGPIGLMALQMAKASGARKIYVAAFSTAEKKCDLALKFGADEIIYTDKINLEEYSFEKGGVDRVLVTAPPKTIGTAVKVTNVGGIVAFLGISYGPDAIVSFDSNVVHLKKLQIRGSNAIPALYFPKCLDLIKAGIVDVKPLISHTFKLDDLPKALVDFVNDKNNAIKAVMIND